MKRRIVSAGLWLLACALAAPLAAVSTKSFDFVNFKDFEEAQLAGVKVSSEGELSPGLDATALKAVEKEIWASLVSPDGRTYFSTGNSASLYRVGKDGPEKVFHADEVAFSCLARGADGTLYIGTLPAGRIYAFDGAKGRLFATLPAPYVWALAVDAEGHLIAGTGPEGVVYRVSPDGAARIHYDARDGNILSVALAPDGTLFAGSAAKGLLYRIKKPGDAEVVWDFKGREIKSLAFHGPRLFLAVNDARARLAGPGSKEGGRASLEFSSIARKLTGRFAGSEVSQEGAELSSESSLLKRYEAGNAASIEELTPDGRVETVWELADSSILDLKAAASGTLYAATGKGGRVYSVVPRALSHLVLTVEEAQAATLAMDKGRLAFVGCANAGTAVLVGPDPPRSGTLTTKPLDTGFPSRFGQARWDGAGPVTLATRSGNTATPDHTWSAWSAPAGPPPAAIGAPPGRYLQARVELGGAASAKLASLRLFYLNQNQSPRVEAVLVGPGKLPEKPGDKDKEGPAGDLKKVTEALSSLAGAAREKSAREEAAKEAAREPIRLDRPASPVKDVRWSAEDKDGDALVYRLYFQGVGEEGWVPLTPKEPLEATTHAWNTESVPDGRYVLKVAASDERGNPPGEELTGEKLTLPFLVDNTRPTLTVRQSAPGVLAIEAADLLTPVVRAEVAIDGQEWKPLHPLDRLSDQLVERYELKLPALPPGPHAIAVRAADAEGNVGASRLLVRIPAK